eukprot:tig00000405_g437.t1
MDSRSNGPHSCRELDEPRARTTLEEGPCSWRRTLVNASKEKAAAEAKQGNGVTGPREQSTATQCFCFDVVVTPAACAAERVPFSDAWLIGALGVHVLAVSGGRCAWCGSERCAVAIAVEGRRTRGEPVCCSLSSRGECGNVLLQVPMESPNSAWSGVERLLSSRGEGQKATCSFIC